MLVSLPKVFSKLEELACIADHVAVFDNIRDVPPFCVEGLFAGGVSRDKFRRFAGKFLVAVPTPEGVVFAHGFGEHVLDAFDILFVVGCRIRVVGDEVEWRNFDGSCSADGSREFRIFIDADLLTPYAAISRFALVHAQCVGDGSVPELIFGGLHVEIAGCIRESPVKFTYVESVL